MKAKFATIGAVFLALCLAATARTITVHPGDSIQAAVNQAVSGDRIEVFPGTYQEAGAPCPQDSALLCGVVISTDNLTLAAQGKAGSVVLQSPGGQDSGIVVAKANVNLPGCLTDTAQRVNGATVSGFTVNGFDNDGILFLCVDNWTLKANNATANPDYGIFPLFCTNGRVTGNSASGANDTGIYIGESHDVRVDHNLATDNVAGFEIENSYNITFDHNSAYNNTGGVLMFIIPGISELVGHDNHVEQNLVISNNRANTCSPGDDVCLIPSGTGILAVAGSNDEISYNAVLNNETGGIGLLDACTAFQLPPDQCALIGYDPLPESTRIAFNVALNNGTNPQSPLFPGSDLLWNGTGTGNCWSHNKSILRVPSVLPGCSQ